MFAVSSIWVRLLFGSGSNPEDYLGLGRVYFHLRRVVSIVSDFPVPGGPKTMILFPGRPLFPISPREVEFELEKVMLGIGQVVGLRNPVN